MTDRHLEAVPTPDDESIDLPRDEDAERACLGAMLRGDRQAIDDVTSILTSADYFQPRHELIHDAIVHHYSRGTIPDPLTVGDRLRDTDDLKRAGGTAYIHELYGGVAVTTNADYYADIVKELSTRRHLIVTANKLRAAAYRPSDTTPQQLLDTARTQLDAIPLRPAGVDETTPGGLDIDTFLGAEDDPYDWLIPDMLERTDRLIVTAGEGHGKALGLNTPVLTTAGWVTMRDVNVGDHVYGPDGHPVKVIAATDTMTDRPCYRVTFSDGEHIIADAQHLWLTDTYQSRRRNAQQLRRGETRPRGTDQRHKRAHFPTVITTEGIRDTLWARDGHTLNHSIPTTAPLDNPQADLLVDPYVLGAWLGDGHTAGARITSADPEIIEQINAAGHPTTKSAGLYGYGIRNLQTHLRTIGVIGNKHIPTAYLRGSIEQRIALLQGLMDTDGTVDAKGRCEFTVTHQRLATDTHELLIGLGVKATLTPSDAFLNGRVTGPRWRIAFCTDLPAFRLPRKAQRLTPRTTARHRLRYITAVEPVPTEPVRCIQVEHHDGMYLAGRALIPTHNSTLLRQLAVQSAAGIHPVTLHPMPPVKVLILDLENSARQSKRKLRPLRLAAGNRLHPGNLIVEIRIEGIDLAQPADVAWLDRLITHHRPDLLISGPIYKMASGDPNDESETKPVVYALDALRAKHGLTLILEAHTKKADGVDPRKRAKDPVGWSGWRRWPEFGLHLSEDGELTHWRGARDERTWPHQLNRGGQWPFTPSISIVDQRVAQIKDCIRAAGQMPSLREIQKATGIPFKSVQRLLEAHAAEFKAITFWSEAESDDDEDGPS